MNEQGGLALKLFTMGIEAAKRRRELAASGGSDFVNELKFKLADKVVFKKIRQKMGGRLMGAMSGSAAMNVEIAQFFFDIGIPIYDCYGMTETSPASIMNASTVPAIPRGLKTKKSCWNLKSSASPTSSKRWPPTGPTARRWE